MPGVGERPGTGDLESGSNGNVFSDLSKSDPMRTHLSDVLGYMIAREFSMRGDFGEKGGPAIL
jgi:hypothetical protein